MKRISTVQAAMEIIDARLTKLKITRSATMHFDGVKSAVMTNFFRGGIKRVQLDTFLALLAGAGLEIWIRPVPRTPKERRKYNEEMGKWLSLADYLPVAYGEGGEDEEVSPVEEDQTSSALPSVPEDQLD